MSEASTTRGAATRERIVAAAAALMHRHGAAGTTTPALRTSAGVSSSQIYHYFQDKNALTEAVIGWWGTHIVEEHVALLERVKDVRGLRRWQKAVVDAAGDHQGCPLGGLAAELSNEQWARAATRAELLRWQRVIGDALSRLVERGVLPEDTDVERHSLAMLAAIQGGLLIGKVTQSSAALEAGLESAVRDLLADRRGARVAAG